MGNPIRPRSSKTGQFRAFGSEFKKPVVAVAYVETVTGRVKGKATGKYIVRKTGEREFLVRKVGAGHYTVREGAAGKYEIHKRGGGQYRVSDQTGAFKAIQSSVYDKATVHGSHAVVDLSEKRRDLRRALVRSKKKAWTKPDISQGPPKF